MHASRNKFTRRQQKLQQRESVTHFKTLIVPEFHSPKSNRKLQTTTTSRLGPGNMKITRRRTSASSMFLWFDSTRIILAAFLWLCCGIATTVEASITVVGTQQTFPSEPAKGIGRHMWKGYEYIGRLQYLPHHLDLCDIQEPVTVTVPQDSVPGRFLGSV